MKKKEYINNKIFGLLLILTMIIYSCKSNLGINQGLELPFVFSDNMVLQQDFDASFWGKSKSNETVSVKGSWGEESSVKSNQKGDWELKLSTPKAGGPYTVTIQTASNSILLKDVMIGEVWLSSGQSNMEWRMNQCINCIYDQDKEISSVDNNQIRMFTVPMDLSGELIKESKWLVANPKNAEGFSAAAYYFARKLNKELKIPIGIVNTSWGGTRVEAWTSNSKLSSLSTTKNKVPKYDDYDLFEKESIKLKDSINDPNSYSILFEKMLKPVLHYSIKGAIWYQGESNVDNSFEYQELFTGMIEDWRESWSYNFSFYYVQIAPFEYLPFQESQKLRDAQRKTLKTTSKTGMAVIMEIGEEKDIHPHNKQDVGKRLALLALDKDYEFDIISSGPLYKSHKTFSNYIDIDFENKGSGLMSKGALKDFEVAGDNMIYKTAKAEIIDNKIRVYSNKVKYPKHVRYGWKNWTVGSLFNKEGLPASSFSSN